MNTTALALGCAFGAMGAAFVTKARSESEPAQRRNKSFAGYFFLLAAAGFLAAFIISLVNGEARQ